MGLGVSPKMIENANLEALEDVGFSDYAYVDVLHPQGLPFVQFESDLFSKVEIP